MTFSEYIRHRQREMVSQWITLKAAAAPATQVDVGWISADEIFFLLLHKTEAANFFIPLCPQGAAPNLVAKPNGLLSFTAIFYLLEVPVDMMMMMMQ